MDKMESNPSTHTGGVKPMSIAGRMVSERERLFGMSDAERAWRAQWLKDQHLAPDEPLHNPEYYKQRYSGFRRFYRAPFDKFENALIPKVGTELAYFFRHVITKTAMASVGVMYVIYYFKYRGSDWTTKSGLKVNMSRPVVYPGQPGYPNFETKQDDDYASYGFKNSPI